MKSLESLQSLASLKKFSSWKFQNPGTSVLYVMSISKNIYGIQWKLVWKMGRIHCFLRCHYYIRKSNQNDNFRAIINTQKFNFFDCRNNVGCFTKVSPKQNNLKFYRTHKCKSIKLSMCSNTVCKTDVYYEFTMIGVNICLYVYMHTKMWNLK